ncbi:MAG TPA: alpha/beta hydrolase [Isosphaeraceae bacterium]|nr:alpha/beta hydrolase [Isosphaeraceae bacterium]
MRRILMALASATILLSALSASAAVDDVNFQQWFDASCQGELKIPKAVAQRAAEFRYVFLGGLKNESMGGYFAQNMKALRALGVPKRAIHELHSRTRKPMEDNVAALREDLQRVAGEGPERLVIIAHSRGACEVMAFALENNDFVSDHVEAMFLVQGPFGGTGLADYLQGEGEPIDGQMSRGQRAMVRITVGLERVFLRRCNRQAMPELTHNASREFWDDMLFEYSDAVPIVSPKTFFVQSQVDPSQLRLLPRAAASYLQTYYGPNDGLVGVRDQSLPGLGTCLGPIDCGHADLTLKFPRSRAPKCFRKALVESIVMTVGQEGQAARDAKREVRADRAGD